MAFQKTVHIIMFEMAVQMYAIFARIFIFIAQLEKCALMQKYVHNKYTKVVTA